ncbi:MAG: hypothetical protein GYB32_12360 [Algicola sp.]|nr:hypothetical protein [Algicola sp.]
MLITTFKNKLQFNQREAHFRELMETMGGLDLLNEKQPAEFRKTLFGSDAVHL